MKNTLLYLAIILGTASPLAYAVSTFKPVNASVKADEVGEIIFNRADWSSSNSEHVTMKREDFLRFFKEGIFRNDINELVYRSEHFQKPLNEKGGWQYCSGAFATKDGKVFFWNRPRVGVLEIKNNQHETGFLVLPEHMKKEKKDSEQPAGGDGKPAPQP